MSNQHPEHELLDRLARLPEAFRPSGPIDTQDLFSGRIDQLARVNEICLETGQHGVIYGERGVGKTSLAAVSTDIQRRRGIVSLRINCDTADTFSQVWEKVIDELILVAKSSSTADREDLRTAIESAIEVMHYTDPITTDRVRLGLRLLAEVTPVVVFFDEFDVISDPDVHGMFANCIKTLSDQLVEATIIIVGVADDVDSLIYEHQSIERALAQVNMPRMEDDEIRAVLTAGLSIVDLDIAEHVAESLTRLTQGLPHYAHLLGQEAARSAIYTRDQIIRQTHFQIALEQSIKKANQSIARAYHTATVSPRRTIFEEVLLACAMAEHDDLGYFAPADVREALTEIMGEVYGIPRFATHLSQFCEPQRGPVLEKRGGERRWRYRFRNPMMEPYVLIRGLNDGRLDAF